MAYIVGAAQILIKPVFTGFQKAAASQVTQGMPAAGQAASSALAGGMASGFRGSAGNTVRTAATTAATTAAAAAAPSFVSRLTSGIRSGATGIHNVIQASLTASTAAATTAGSAVGGSFVGAVTRALGPLSAMFGAGAVIGGGFNRLANIEDAQAKLTGLGHSAETVTQVMNNALGSVQGTAFGLDEAATVAAGLIASGIQPGEELQRVLSGVADAATIGGTSLADMGAIYNKVAAGGRIQGEELAQLGDRGIPILQLLAQHLGVSAQEVRELAAEGEIGFADFAAAMQAGMSGAALKSGETTRGTLRNVGAAVSRLGATIMDEIFPKIKEWGGLAITVIDGQVIPAFKNAAAWVKENASSLTPWITAVGALVGAFVTYRATMAVVTAVTRAYAAVAALVRGVMFAWTAATKGQAAAQLALNGAVMANPIGLIVVALAGLVAAVVLAWKNSETFRNIVTGAWEGIKAAAGAVVDWFIGTALPFLQSVWDGIAAGATWLWQNALQPAWEGIKTGWGAMVTAAVWAWENLLKPAWDAISTAAQWLWNTVLSPVFTAISSAWSSMAGFMMAVWTNVIKLAWDLMVFAAKWMWTNVLKPTWDNIVAGWNLLGALIKLGWERVLKPAWDAVAAAGKWLWENALKPAFNWIKGGWEGLVNGIKSFWTNVLKPVFEAVGGFITNTVVPGFQRGIDTIKSIWDSLRNAFAIPINWVLENVWDGGIKKAFDTVARAIGSEARLPAAPRISTGGSSGGGGGGRAVAARAKGGPVRAGQPYLVGEEGPELITPTRSGWVHTAKESERMLPRAGDRHGGFWDDVGGVVSSVGRSIGSAAGQALSWVRGGLANAAGLLLDPLKNLIRNTVSRWGDVGGLAGGAVNNSIDKLLDWIRGKDEESTAGGAFVPGGSGARIPGAVPWVNAAGHNIANGIGFPGMRMVALTRSMVGDHKWGGALDLYGSNAQREAAANYAAAHAGRLGVRVVLANRRMWTAGSGWGAQPRSYGGNDPWHTAHTHVGWNRNVAGRVPKFDDGGYLQPGIHATANLTRKPEPVLTSQQWSDIHRLATANTNGGGPQRVWQVENLHTGASADEVLAAAEWRERTAAL